MKIIQLNVWGGKLGKQIIEVLEREQPDVACFQEVVDFSIDADIFFTGLNRLAQAGNFEHVLSSPTFGFSYMNQPATFGNVILSKTPLDKTETIFTGNEYVEQMDLLDGDYNIRNLQLASVTVGGETYNILNHHGHHIHEHKRGDEETMRQCKIIADHIKKLEGPTILCGDFNLAPDSESIEQINAMMTNHAKEREVITTRTPLTHKTEVCDYIFTSPDVTVTNFQVLDDIASDHKAVMLECAA